MKSLNQSFLLLNPQLEKILQTKYLPDPEIFSSLTLEACFDYFHRKDALVNFTKLKEKELFNINPLIENKISVEEIPTNELKYNRFVDVLEIINKNRFIDKKNEPGNLENPMNLNVDLDDRGNKFENDENLQVGSLSNDSNIESSYKVIYDNCLLAERSNNINNNYCVNQNEKINTNIKKVPCFKITEENVKIKTNQGNYKKVNKGMLVQLSVRDEIINGIILENNKIQCAFEGCEKIFKNKYKLKDHLVTHSNNKTFACSIDECSRTFKRRQTLNRHIRSFHQRITRHQCKFCSVVFTNFNYCDKAFPIKSSLVSHMRQFHKMEPN